MAPPQVSVLPYFEQLGEALGRNLAARMGAARSPAPVVVAPSVTGRPARKSKPAARPAARRATSARRAAPALTSASAPEPGALVSYRQGRGTFAAEVVRVDTFTGVATLQRTKDGKRVVRPLDRIYAAKP